MIGRMLRNWRHKTLSLLVIAAAIITGGFVAVEPAAAAYSDCGVGLFCLWDGPNGTGNRLTFSYSGSGGALTCNFLSVTWDNKNMSFRNGLGSGRGVVWFDNACATNGTITPLTTVGTPDNQNYPVGSTYYHRFSTFFIT